VRWTYDLAGGQVSVAFIYDSPESCDAPSSLLPVIGVVIDLEMRLKRSDMAAVWRTAAAAAVSPIGSLLST